MRCSSLCWSVIRTGVFFFVSELWKEHRLDISQMKVVSACVIVEGIRKWNFVVVWMKLWMCHVPLIYWSDKEFYGQQMGRPLLVSLCVSVRPSICPLVWTNSHAADFSKIWYLGFVMNCVHPLRFCLMHSTLLPTCIYVAVICNGAFVVCHARAERPKKRLKMHTPGVIREKYGKYIIYRNEKYIEIELCFWATWKV